MKTTNRIKHVLYKMMYVITSFFGINIFVPVLCFHWFIKEATSNNIYYSPINSFDNQLNLLKRKGYSFISKDQFVDWICDDKKLPRKPILLTFDDGEVSQLNLVTEILKKYDAKGLCFVVGKHYIDNNSIIDEYEDKIEHFSIDDYNNSKYKDILSLGSHTYDMHKMINNKPYINIINEKEIELDFINMSKLKFDSFAAPYGMYNDTLDKMIEKYHKIGFALRNTNCPYATKHNKQRINRLTVCGNNDNNDVIKKYLY